MSIEIIRCSVRRIETTKPDKKQFVAKSHCIFSIWRNNAPLLGYHERPMTVVFMPRIQTSRVYEFMGVNPPSFPSIPQHENAALVLLSSHHMYHFNLLSWTFFNKISHTSIVLLNLSFFILSSFVIYYRVCTYKSILCPYCRNVDRISHTSHVIISSYIIVYVFVKLLVSNCENKIAKLWRCIGILIEFWSSIVSCWQCADIQQSEDLTCLLRLRENLSIYCISDVESVRS